MSFWTPTLLLSGPFDPTGGQLRLLIFATGARGGSVLSATIAGRSVTVESMQRSRDLPGLDELHILIPPDLRGAGNVTLSVVSDNHESNAIEVTLAVVSKETFLSMNCWPTRPMASPVTPITTVCATLRRTNLLSWLIRLQEILISVAISCRLADQADHGHPSSQICWREQSYRQEPRSSSLGVELLIQLTAHLAEQVSTRHQPADCRC